MLRIELSRSDVNHKTLPKLKKIVVKSSFCKELVITIKIMLSLLLWRDRTVATTVTSVQAQRCLLLEDDA